MSLLLCAATEFEVAPTLQFLVEKNLSSKVTVLLTGVGLPATMYALTRQVMNNPPTLIIQAGLGGSLSDHFPLAEVVVVERDCFGDLGVEENGTFKNLLHMKLAACDEKLGQDQWLANPHSALLRDSDLVRVSACSVNEISTAPHRIQHYKAMGAQVESMEGAALHYLALMEGVAFLQIRAVSNYVGERDKSRWTLKESIQRLNVELQRIIIKLLSA